MISERPSFIAHDGQRSRAGASLALPGIFPPDFWYALGTGSAAVLVLVIIIPSPVVVCIYWATILAWSPCSSAYWRDALWRETLDDLGFFQFQPSEFAKLAFILAQANFLSRPVEELRQPAYFWKDLAVDAAVCAHHERAGFGSALVLMPTGGMMFCRGIPRRYLIQLFTVVGVLGTLLLATSFAPRAADQTGGLPGQRLCFLPGLPPIWLCRMPHRQSFVA